MQKVPETNTMWVKYNHQGTYTGMGKVGSIHWCSQTAFVASFFKTESGLLIFLHSSTADIN